MGWLGTAVNTVFPGTGGIVEGAFGGSDEAEQIARAGRAYGSDLQRLGGTQAAATGQALGMQLGGLQEAQQISQAAQPAVSGEYTRAVGAVQPFAQAGRGVLPELQQAATAQRQPLTSQQLLQTPGVQFRLGEAQKALERGASARGMLLSGGHQRELGRYMQDLASQEYAAEDERRRVAEQDRLRAMQGLAGTGLAAAGTEAQARQALGQLTQQQAQQQAGYAQQLAGGRAQQFLRPHEIRAQAGLTASGVGTQAQQAGLQAQQAQNAALLQTAGTLGGAVLGGPIGAGIGGALAGQAAPAQVQPVQAPQQTPQNVSYYYA